MTGLLLVLRPAPANAAISQVQNAPGSSRQGSTALTVSMSTTPAAGDVMIASVTTGAAVTITPPTGWTLLLSTSKGTMQQSSYARVAGSGEPNTWTWSLPTSTPVSGGVVEYRGVDTSFPVDQNAAATGTSGDAAAPSVTTQYAGDLVFSASSFALTTTVNADPTATGDYSSTSNATTSFAEEKTQASAGPTSAVASTPANSTAAWIDQTVALKPASASGLLSLVTSSAPSFGASLDNGDQAPTYTLPVTVTDTRSSAVGWNTTITSTQFTTGGATPRTLATTASSITGATASCQSYGCVAPTNAVAYPLTVPAATTAPTALKFFNAAAATGRGQASVTPTIAVSVPQNSFAGTYTSTVTVSVVSGP